MILKRLVHPLFISILFSSITTICFFKTRSFELEKYYFNSDCLYIESVYLDFFFSKTSIDGWSFNAAPNIFPDFIIYSFLRLFVSDFRLAYLIFSVLQYTLIALLVYYMLNLISRKNIISSIIAFSSLLIPHLILITFNDFSFFFQFVSISYHLGALVNTLLFFILLVQFRPSSLFHNFLMSLLLILAPFSDRLFLVLAIIPFLLVYLFTFKQRTKKSNVIALYSLASILLTILSISYFQNTTPRIEKPYKVLSLIDIQDSLAVFMDHMQILFSLHYSTSIFIIVLFASLFIALYQVLIFFLKQYHSKTNNIIGYKKIIIFLIAISGLLGLIAPIINGSYSGFDCIRYSIPSFVILQLGLSLFVSEKIKQPLFSPEVKYYGLFYFITILFISFIFLNSSKQEITTFKPQEAKELDSLAQIYKLHNGVAGYWSAKKNQYFSSSKLNILPILDSRGIYWHANNKNWYFSEENQNNKQFDFVIVTSEIDTTVLFQHLPLSRRIVTSKSFKLVLTEPFTFNKDTEIIEANNEN